jgi:hypothetical protein
MLPELREHHDEHGQPGHRKQHAEQDTAPRKSGGTPPHRQDERVARIAEAGVADDMDVDARTGRPNHSPDDRTAREPLPPGATARTHDDLRGIERPRRVDEPLARVGAHDLVVRAAELLDELALVPEQSGGRGREPVLRNDVNGDKVAVHALRHARCPADDPLAVARARQRHEHALTRLPRLHDPMALPVFREPLFDTVGEPGEGKLSQRSEVACAEVVRRGRVDPLRRIDVTPCKPVP